MKILFSYHFFYPSVGGIEQFTLALAREFSMAGHVVKVMMRGLLKILTNDG